MEYASPPVRRAWLPMLLWAALLALGYAGWGPGQLDRELRENSWLSVPVAAEDVGLVFDDDHASKWQRALGRLGVDPVLLSGTGGRA